MKISNINNSHVYWFGVFILTLWSLYLVWTERMAALFYLVPLLFVLGAHHAARRWKQKQKSRLIAHYQSIKTLFWFFFAMAIVGIIATFCAPNEKMHFAPLVFLVAMLAMAGDYKRYGRWVKKKPTLATA